MIGATLAGLAATSSGLLVVATIAHLDRLEVRRAAGVHLVPRAGGRLSASTVGASIAVVAAAGLGATLAGLAGAVAGGVVCIAVPRVRRRRRARAELVALEDGLADVVAAVAAAMRAGRSMAGAFEEAASTAPPPLGPRLRALVDSAALGVPFDEAVADLGSTLPGSEGRLLAAVVGLHQRSGGDAPAVLDRVARTLRDRRATAREVESLTAQARLSGAILGLLPIGFFLFLSVTARDDVERAAGSATGRTAILLGLLMQGAAFLWIRRLLRVEP